LIGCEDGRESGRRRFWLPENGRFDPASKCDDGPVLCGREPKDMAHPELVSRIACPHCGKTRTEVMPTDACLFFYQCPACNTVIAPKQGDCCVFCSYGSTPCPPVQSGQGCCGSSAAK
jgi:hypothetical protein